LQKLKRRAGRAKVFNYRAAIWDGGAKLPTKTKFQGVLVDAPCSGVGTWQRNPHARWTITPEDGKELSHVQRQILTNAGASVKPGGKLIYSVCTLTRTETVEVAEMFGKTHPEFGPLVLPEILTAEKSQSLPASAATITIWPQQSGGGGMFIAGWRRRPVQASV